MARYTVTLTTSANTAVDVEVPDHVTDPETIAALAVEALEAEGRELCNSCDRTVDLGDDWRPVRSDGAVTVTRH